MLPKEIAKLVPRARLMSETEWRRLGVQQSQGWVHYMLHSPGQTYLCRLVVVEYSLSLSLSLSLNMHTLRASHSSIQKANY